MDFTINKTNLNSALREILQGQKAGSNETVDLTAAQGNLLVVITGRSIEVPVESAARSLNAVGVSHHEIRDIATAKIRKHATGLGNILFDHGVDA